MYVCLSVDPLHFVSSGVHKCDVDIEPTHRENLFFFLFYSLHSPFLIHSISMKVCAALVTRTLQRRGVRRNLGSTIAGQKSRAPITWPMARGFAPAKA
jgi:hypothetical protein